MRSRIVPKEVTWRLQRGHFEGPGRTNISISMKPEIKDVRIWELQPKWGPPRLAGRSCFLNVAVGALLLSNTSQGLRSWVSSWVHPSLPRVGQGRLADKKQGQKEGCEIKHSYRMGMSEKHEEPTKRLASGQPHKHGTSIGRMEEG